MGSSSLSSAGSLTPAASVQGSVPASAFRPQWQHASPGQTQGYRSLWATLNIWGLTVAVIKEKVVELYQLCDRNDKEEERTSGAHREGRFLYAHLYGEDRLRGSRARAPPVPSVDVHLLDEPDDRRGEKGWGFLGQNIALDTEIIQAILEADSR